MKDCRISLSRCLSEAHSLTSAPPVILRVRLSACARAYMLAFFIRMPLLGTADGNTDTHTLSTLLNISPAHELFFYILSSLHSGENVYQMTSQLECVAWNPVNTLASTIKR